MDRRRFVPQSDDLEGRQLLSTATSTTSTQPITFQAKSFRIENLPRLLASVQDQSVNRFLPADTVARLQADLQAIEGQLRIPSSTAKLQFQKSLRNVIRHTSFSQGDALNLSSTFAQVLSTAGASDQQVFQLQFDMNDLAATDSKGVNAPLLASNDYAIVLETALAVGRPIHTPAAPHLLAADDTGAKGDRSTGVHQPHLAGAYDAGATIDIVDAAGTVLGTGTADSTGHYSVAFAKPLTDGTYTVSVRATIEYAVSPLSAPYTFRVVPKVTAKGR